MTNELALADELDRLADLLDNDHRCVAGVLRCLAAYLREDCDE